MYAQCPECLALYELDAATLAQAGGSVGCGQCGATFNALTTLAETLPSGAFEHLPVHAASPAPPILMMTTPRTPAATAAPDAPTADRDEDRDTGAAVPRDDAALLADFMAYLQADTPGSEAPAAQDHGTTDTSTDVPADAPAATDATDDLPAIDASRSTTEVAAVSDTPAAPDADVPPEGNTDEVDTDDTGTDRESMPDIHTEPAPPTPSFAIHRRRHTTVAPPHTWRWIAGCAVLLVCLGLQLTWAERQALAANPTTRPWLARACDWAGCQVPTVSDLSDLELLSRDVRPHPTVPGALLISATVRNNATFAQPYPVVSITLSDLDQNRIAMRRFRPASYIADAGTRAAGLAPGATTALMFEVRDPGRNAIAFEFAFQ